MSNWYSHARIAANPRPVPGYPSTLDAIKDAPRATWQGINDLYDGKLDIHNKVRPLYDKAKGVLQDIGQTQATLCKALGLSLAGLLISNKELADKAVLFLHGAYRWTADDSKQLLTLCLDYSVKIPTSAVALGFFPPTPFPKIYPYVIMWWLGKGNKMPDNPQGKQKVLSYIDKVLKWMLPSNFSHAVDSVKAEEKMAALEIALLKMSAA